MMSRQDKAAMLQYWAENERLDQLNLTTAMNETTTFTAQIPLGNKLALLGRGRTKRDTRFEGCMHADTSRLPAQPNRHSLKVLNCLLTSSDGIMMDMDVLQLCFKRFRANVNDDEVRQWFAIHYSDNYDTCMDELLAKFTAPTPDDPSVVVTIETISHGAQRISQTTELQTPAAPARFTHLVCVRYLIEAVPLVVVPCPYFENRGYNYDLTQADSLGDFVDNYCNIEVTLSDSHLLDRHLETDIKVYPGDQAFLCTFEEGDYAIKRDANDGAFYIHNKAEANSFDVGWFCVFLLGCICLVMSILTILVLTQDGYFKRSHINVYLLVIAITDTVYIMIKLSELITRDHGNEFYSGFHLTLVIWDKSPISCLFNAISIYFCKAFILFVTLVVTIERFVAIQFPIYAKVSSSRTKAIKLSLIAFCLALIVSFGNLLALESSKISTYDMSATLCHADPKYALTSTAIDISINLYGYNDEISLFILIVCWLTPFVIVAILSVLIPSLLFWKRHQRKKMAATNKATQKREYMITLMFSVVTTTTFVFLIPDIFMASYMNTLYRYFISGYGFDSGVNELIMAFALEILEVVSCGKNFILYNLVTSDFRAAHINLWKSLWVRLTACKQYIGALFVVESTQSTMTSGSKVVSKLATSSGVSNKTGSKSAMSPESSSKTGSK